MFSQIIEHRSDLREIKIVYCNDPKLCSSKLIIGKQNNMVEFTDERFMSISIYVDIMELNTIKIVKFYTMSVRLQNKCHYFLYETIT